MVDYEAGNLRSVETSLRKVGADFFVTDDPAEITKADKIIFPGVGEARAAMDVLNKKGIGEGIKEFIRSGKPFLGICIGYQILFDGSEERDTACLGIISGKVRRFPEKKGHKVPHMGWNEVIPVDGGILFEGIEQGSSFYFVHSYYPEPANKNEIYAETDYIIRFASAYKNGNLFAVQFHPEKSGKAGLQLISNFIRWNG